MHAHTINYYCHHHNYFTVCALQVISLIILSIQSMIFGNSKERAVVCFEKISFSVRFDSFHIFDALIFILHHSHLLFSFSILSHSYYKFYCGDSSIERPAFTRGCWLQWGRRTYFRKLSVSRSLGHNSTVANQSWIWPSREHGIFSTHTEISLLGGAFSFIRTNMCLCLKWSLLS